MLIFPQIAAQTLKPPWFKTSPCSIYVLTARPSAAQPDNCRLRKVLGLPRVFIFSPSLLGPREQWEAAWCCGQIGGAGQLCRTGGTGGRSSLCPGHWCSGTGSKQPLGTHHPKMKVPTFNVRFIYLFLFFLNGCLKVSSSPLPSHWEIIPFVPVGANGASGCA